MNKLDWQAATSSPVAKAQRYFAEDLAAKQKPEQAMGKPIQTCLPIILDRQVL